MRPWNERHILMEHRLCTISTLLTNRWVGTCQRSELTDLISDLIYPRERKDSDWEENFKQAQEELFQLLPELSRFKGKVLDLKTAESILGIKGENEKISFRFKALNFKERL